MKTSNIYSKRKAMGLALGLSGLILALIWLLGGSRINALSGVVSNSPDQASPNNAALLASVGTSFTYQGSLSEGGSPANGTYDFKFELFDAANGGNKMPTTNFGSDKAVSGGLFNQLLNFGDVFDGKALWLQISVRPSNSTGAYTTLAPRQPLSATPYAHSLRPGATVGGSINDAAMISLVNDGTNGIGLSVETTGIGINVQSSTSTGVYVGSSAASAFYVEDAATNGLRVFKAQTGVNINVATQDGVFVCVTGNRTTCTPNNSIHSGVEVGNAEHYGLWVTDAGNDGVFIVNAGDDGMQVVNAGDDGIDIQNATDDGIRIRTTGGDGIHIESPTGNGINVDAGFIGVYVSDTDATGFLSQNAGASGFFVAGAGGYGVRVSSSTDFAGSFNGNIEVSGACTGCLLATFGVNSGDTPLKFGDVVSLDSISTGDSVGQPMLMDVRLAQTGAPLIGVVYGRAELVEFEELDGQITTHLSPREGVIQPGDYVHIVTYGPMQINASALEGSIQLGDKLSIGASGVARRLQTRMLDGIQITESGPIIGMALEGLDADQDGLIWVMVNPQ